MWTSVPVISAFGFLLEPESDVKDVIHYTK